MPYRPRPKSSVTKKSTRSSLHPKGAPTVSETLEGLARGLANLGSGLAGAAKGMAGNVVGSLMQLRASGKGGDEEAAQAYEKALAMLRDSGDAEADELLRLLGESPEEEPEEEGKEASQPNENISTNELLRQLSEQLGEDTDQSKGTKH